MDRLFVNIFPSFRGSVWIGSWTASGFFRGLESDSPFHFRGGMGLEASIPLRLNELPFDMSEVPYGSTLSTLTIIVRRHSRHNRINRRRSRHRTHTKGQTQPDTPAAVSNTTATPGARNGRVLWAYVSYWRRIKKTVTCTRCWGRLSSTTADKL